MAYVKKLWCDANGIVHHTVNHIEKDHTAHFCYCSSGNAAGNAIDGHYPKNGAFATCISCIVNVERAWHEWL